jgi:hypothetical protein
LGAKSTVGRTARFGFPRERHFPHSERSGQSKRARFRIGNRVRRFALTIANESGAG